MTTSLKLFQAIEANDVEAVKSLIASNPSLAAARNEAGLSAVMYATYRGAAPIAAALIAAHPGLDIFEAAAAGDTARAAALLKADPKVASAKSADGGTALHFACFFRHPEIARMLIDRGSDLEAVANAFGGVTPLHAAAAGRNPEAVEALLKAGANPNALQHVGFTALHSAANNGDVDSVRSLLAHNADRSIKTGDGKTAADIAREKGHAEVLAMLE